MGLINFSEVTKTLQDIRSGKIKEGERLGVPEIDEHIRFKEGNFNVVLGHANVGKTTVILYLMLCYSKKLKKRWLIYSSENESHSIIRKLVEFLDLKPLNKISEVDFKNHLEFINDHFKIIDNNTLYSYRSLLELSKHIKAAWDYNGLLIDPYNSLIKDPDLIKNLGGHEYDYQATSEIRMFCKENNITTWLNTHPIPPLASDVEGGGKFVNRADDFIVIHRYTQHLTNWMESHVHIRKVKEIETGGRPTSIDDPIKMRSIPNNVGFEINGVKLIKEPLREPTKIPF